MARGDASHYRRNMTNHRCFTACVAALVAAVALACEDIPLLPTWDAEFNVPLPSQRIGLLGPFPAAVPPGASANVSFAPQQEQLDNAVGSLLGDQLNAARVVVTLSTTVPLDGADTVFVASTAADLTNPAAPRVVVPVTLVASVPTTLDTITVTASGLQMLQNAAQSDGTLFIQLRGRVTYPGPGIRVLTASDSIGVRLALLARIAVSR